MNWIPLTTINQIDTIQNASNTIPQIIFKHSTRCSISTTVRDRLERPEPPPGVVFYYLDLLAHRDVSNKIAEVFNVEHESPQVLLIKHGKCIYHENHMAIEMEELIEQLQKS